MKEMNAKRKKDKGRERMTKKELTKKNDDKINEEW